MIRRHSGALAFCERTRNPWSLSGFRIMDSGPAPSRRIPE
ncbi:MAG: hypothetical protein OJF48_001332 [Afipia sp.]|nr:MAG: hypothetical protein OJF48_001332 [Afipia sp.]